MREPVTVIGEISKPSGIDGSMRIVLHYPVEVLPSKLNWLHISVSKKPVPFKVEEWYEESSTSIVVKLAGINSPDAVKQHLRTEVYSETKNLKIKKPKHAFSDFEDFIIFDQNKRRLGKIIEFLDFSGSLVFNIEGVKTNFLVPVHDDLVIKADLKNKEIYMEIPDGLADL